MSRSFRKPYWTEGYGGKWRSIAKRQASKKVRQAKSVGNGAYYRRIYDSWSICDYKFLEPSNSERIWKVRRK